MATQTYVNAVTLSSAAEWNKWDTAAYCALTGAAGTNTITATGPANLTSVATNPPLWFIPAATNTGATTINITPSGGAALGAKNVFYNGAALVAGEIRINVPCVIVYDGTQYNLVAPARASNITLATEQASTSGTSIDFTGIPAGTKRITIMFDSVSTNGTSLLMVQIGDAGGPEITVYVSDSVQVTNAGASVGVTGTTGFVTATAAAAGIRNGTMTLTLMNAATFKWVSTHVFDRVDGGGVTTISGAGIKSLSAELTQVRITTVNGTDAFDAGAINISYE